MNITTTTLLAALAALAIGGVILLAGVGQEIPDVLNRVADVIVGSLAGATIALGGREIAAANADKLRRALWRGDDDKA